MDKIEREFRARFNEPVITSFEVGRVVGYGEDAMDCYLIVAYPDKPDIWHTAVGGYIFLTMLKGQGVVYANSGEIWNDFTRLDGWLSMNGCGRRTEFEVVKR